MNFPNKIELLSLVRPFKACICIAAILLLVGSVSALEIQKSSLFEVQTTDGKKGEAALQKFNPNDETMHFVTAAGKEIVIPCDKLTQQTLGRTAMRMPVIANFLPKVSSDLCDVLVNARSLPEEEAALGKIFQAGSESATKKENLALFQLYGVIYQLLSAELTLNEALPILQKAEKEAAKVMADTKEEIRKNRINPITGEDRAPRWMDHANRRVAKILEDPRRQMLRAKSGFMMRLASVKAYAIRCDNLKQPDVAKSLEELRAKVIQRSFVGQELEKAGNAILGWLISRTMLHHDEGAVGFFGKMFVDAQVDQAFDTLFFDLPEEQRALATGVLKGALIKITEGRITLADIAQGSTREALLKVMATQSPEMKARVEVVERIMPFLEEAVRLSSK